MRVGIFLTTRCFSRDGGFWADESYAHFFVALARGFSHTTFCVPVTEGHVDEGNFRLDMDEARISIQPMPFFRGAKDQYLRYPLLRRAYSVAMKPLWNRFDLFITMAPNLLGLHLARQARKNGVPPTFFVRGDFLKTVRFEYANSRMKALPIGLARYMEWSSLRLMRHTTTFVVGRDLQRKYREKGVETVPINISLISSEDIVRGRRLPEKDHFDILCVGRLSPEKGGVTLMESLSLLEKTMPGKIQVNMVGDGADEARLRAMAREYGLNVHFLGFVPYGPRVQALYRDADLFVLPSYTEGFPLVLLEAMAHACPIVATAVGGVGWVMEHEQNSLIVPPRDAKALAEAIARILQDRPLRQRLLDRATQDIEQYTVENMAKIFKEHAPTRQSLAKEDR